MGGKVPESNNLLTSYLNEYVKMTKPQFAVMITGKWGCGKTHYIEHIICEWEKKDVKTDKDSIRLNPIYVSVYGMQSIGEVIRQIKTKLYPLLYSKGAKVAQKVILTVLQVITKSTVDLDKDGTGEVLSDLLDADGVLELFKIDSSSIKGDKILVLDDLERSRIPLDELFGFVNSIVEHSNSKVILICDEDKLVTLDKKDELKIKYKDFKEKIVGKTFLLKVDYVEITKFFINDSGEKILKNNQKLIVDLFVASRCENLRIIKQCLSDIVRLFNQIPKEIEKNDNYALFVKNVVAYFVIASIEDRFGNDNIDSYQSSLLINCASDKNNDIESKYNSILYYHKLSHSAHSISIATLLKFVRTGYINEPKRIVAECGMLKSKNMSNWEKLWNCNSLSNEEFICLLKIEKTRFYKKNLEYSFEVVHLAGILLSLENRGLIKLNRRYVVSIAKRSIDKINKKYPNDMVRLMPNGQGYEFQDYNSSEMQDILSYASSHFQKQIDRMEEEFIVRAWDELEAGMTHRDIETLFDQPKPIHQRTYAMENIFTQVSPEAIAKKIVALPNATKLEFSYFLMGRYFLVGGMTGIISSEMKKDKASLIKLSTILKSKAKRLKFIEKEQTLLIASKIDEAIAKMEEPLDV